MLEQSRKKVYSRATTKSIPLLQSEHGFCQQNGPDRGQVQEWYSNEKRWWAVFVCLNGRYFLQGVWILYRINNDVGDKSLPFLVFRRDAVRVIFLKYSK